MTTTTVRQLTGANVQVLREYRDHLDGVIEIGQTYIKFFGTADQALKTITELKEHLHTTKGGRSFENRSMAAVVNKLDRFVYGGGDKHVSEKK